MNSQRLSHNIDINDEAEQNFIKQMPIDFNEKLETDIDEAGGPWEELEEFKGAVGRTMFDTPISRDNTVTVLLPPDQIKNIPSQSLVRIKSRPKDNGGDGKQYLAMVVQGPFAEPDGLRADAPIVVTTTVRGATFMPRYHGRVQVELLGEEIDGTIVPPRFRPLPNSPVFVLAPSEMTEKLRLTGEITLGLAVGYEDMQVSWPVTRKDVFPRHVGLLGTTGSGKSTTVSKLIGALGDNNVAVVVFDTEGEYTHLMHPTDNKMMISALEKRKIKPIGASKVSVYHLVGRESTNPDCAQPFTLNYDNLSPYAVMEILDLNEAQEQRFLKAYDIAKRMLIELKIYPTTDAEKARLLELDEMESGYPKLTLAMLYDIVRACAHHVAEEPDFPYFQTKSFFQKKDRIMEIIQGANLPGHVWSWRKIQGNLSRLLRLGIFDSTNTTALNYDIITQPGEITIIDLSDTDSPQVNNLVIAEILRGLRLQQEDNYKAAEHGKAMRKVAIVIEEAHEFLSSERIKQMPVLFQQVARIARRGRKRWLGLIFVTQLPQHLPDEVLGLINNYILHKIGDSNIISRLKRSIGGIDDTLWDKLPNLAPGQAIVAAASMARPLLIAIDPTPSKLRMVD